MKTDGSSYLHEEKGALEMGNIRAQLAFHFFLTKEFLLLSNEVHVSSFWVKNTSSIVLILQKLVFCLLILQPLQETQPGLSVHHFLLLNSLPCRSNLCSHLSSQHFDSHTFCIPTAKQWLGTIIREQWLYFFISHFKIKAHFEFGNNHTFFTYSLASFDKFAIG